MANIADYSPVDVLRLQNVLRAELADCPSLESAAKVISRVLYEYFAESALLVRCFVTVPYGMLPPDIRLHVLETTRIKGFEFALTDSTLTLALLGTRGIEPAWNERRFSAAHAGIPLISAEFIDQIPMVARLLKELEIDLSWITDLDERFVERRQNAGWTGLFHVLDAAHALDDSGRPIIPAQDFVLKYGVQTVFGLGGIYKDHTIFTLVVFARDKIDKETLEQLVPVVTSIRTATAHLVQDRLIFD